LQNLAPGGDTASIIGQPSQEALGDVIDLQRQISLLIKDAQDLSKQDIVTEEQTKAINDRFNAINNAYQSAISSGAEINQNFSQLIAQLGTAIANLGTSAEQTEEAQNAFKPFEDAIKATNTELDNLRKAMHNFRITSKQDIDATASAWNSLGKTLQAYIDKLNIAISKQGSLKSIPNQFFGGPITRQAGGSVGKDSVPILASPGEFVLNERASRKFLPQLIAMNSGSRRFESGGPVTNNSIGDINVSVTQPGSDARTIAETIRREIRRNTVRLN
jgi:hypothetical protein